MKNIRKLHVTQVNPHLLCVLCGGYYVDATTIIECLHSFCKSCIVKYLKSNKFCPICDVLVHKHEPLQSLRSDLTLQSFVYKLVPNLYAREMSARKSFYSNYYPENRPIDSESCGEITEFSKFYSTNDIIDFTLEYVNYIGDGDQSYFFAAKSSIKYFRSLAIVTVRDIQKLLNLKYNLSSNKVVYLFFGNVQLPGDLTLMDIAYISSWRRTGCIQLMYQILEVRKMVIERNRININPPLGFPALTPVTSDNIFKIPIKSTSVKSTIKHSKPFTIAAKEITINNTSKNDCCDISESSNEFTNHKIYSLHSKMEKIISTAEKKNEFRPDDNIEKVISNSGNIKNESNNTLIFKKRKLGIMESSSEVKKNKEDVNISNSTEKQIQLRTVPKLPKIVTTVVTNDMEVVTGTTPSLMCDSKKLIFPHEKMQIPKSQNTYQGPNSRPIFTRSNTFVKNTPVAIDTMKLKKHVVSGHPPTPTFVPTKSTSSQVFGTKSIKITSTNLSKLVGANSNPVATSISRNIPLDISITASESNDSKKSSFGLARKINIETLNSHINESASNNLLSSLNSVNSFVPKKSSEIRTNNLFAPCTVVNSTKKSNNTTPTLKKSSTQANFSCKTNSNYSLKKMEAITSNYCNSISGSPFFLNLKHSSFSPLYTTCISNINKKYLIQDETASSHSSKSSDMCVDVSKITSHQPTTSLNDFSKQN